MEKRIKITICISLVENVVKILHGVYIFVCHTNFLDNSSGSDHVRSNGKMEENSENPSKFNLLIFRTDTFCELVRWCNQSVQNSEKVLSIWIYFKLILMIYSLSNAVSCLMLLKEASKYLFLIFILIDLVLLVFVIKYFDQLDEREGCAQTIRERQTISGTIQCLDATTQFDTNTSLNHVHATDDSKPPSYEEAIRTS